MGLMPSSAMAFRWLGLLPVGEDAAVDGRMQGLDPAVHDLGEAGDLGDAGDGQPGLLQMAGRAPGGDHLDPQLDQTPHEGLQILLVRYRNQRPRDLHRLLPRSPPVSIPALFARLRSAPQSTCTTRLPGSGGLTLPAAMRRMVAGSNRCSTSWMRAARVSGVSPSSTRTGSWAMTGPVSTPGSTKWTVTPVTLTP